MKREQLTKEQREREAKFCFEKAQRDGTVGDHILYSGAFEIVAAAPGQLLLEEDGMDSGFVKLVIPLLSSPGDDFNSMNKKFVGRRVCVVVQFMPVD